MPHLASGDHREPSLSIEEGAPHAGESGERLRRRLDVLHEDSGHCEPDDRGGRGHPVIVICVEPATVQIAGGDDQTVVGLLDRSTEPGDLPLQCCESVGLMASKVCDATQDTASIGEQGYGSHGGCRLADSGKIDVDRLDAVGAVNEES